MDNLNQIQIVTGSAGSISPKGEDDNGRLMFDIWRRTEHADSILQ